jgi:mono/diheme cytochrome c family protein
MRMTLATLVIFSAIALGVLAAQNKPRIKHVPLSPTSAASGEEMFTTYCAVCHGIDGKGGGPAAAALKTTPANLTQLSVKNGGTYPEPHVVQILTAGTLLAHGSADMPVWGDLFKSLNGGSQSMANMRVANLTAYIKSIQGK